MLAYWPIGAPAYPAYSLLLSYPAYSPLLSYPAFPAYPAYSLLTTELPSLQPTGLLEPPGPASLAEVAYARIDEQPQIELH